MKNTDSLEVGDNVHYVFGPIMGWLEEARYENGRVKEVVDEKYVRVVYKCDNKWDDFMNYTSALTHVSDLHEGWV